MTSETEPSPRPRRGRRPGRGNTRQVVLDAARARFANDGFTATTIRRIASDAEVDASLVMQFFRSKDELFAAAMEVPQVVLERFDTAFEGPDASLGERVVRAYLSAWEGSPEESEPLRAMLRGAIVNEFAAMQLRDFLQSRLMRGASHRPGTDTGLRAGLAAAMLVGVVTSRDIIGVPIISNARSDEIVRLLAPAVQEVLTRGSVAEGEDPSS